jgi:hypothetical protein
MAQVNQIMAEMTRFLEVSTWIRSDIPVKCLEIAKDPQPLELDSKKQWSRMDTEEWERTFTESAFFIC